MTTPILERNCSDGVPTVGGSFGGEDAPLRMLATFALRKSRLLKREWRVFRSHA